MDRSNFSRDFSFRSTIRGIDEAERPVARFWRVTGNSSRVAAAQRTDMEPLISVMFLAFAGDPVARWMYRNARRYFAYFGRFIRMPSVLDRRLEIRRYGPFGRVSLR